MSVNNVHEKDGDLVVVTMGKKLKHPTVTGIIAVPMSYVQLRLGPKASSHPRLRGEPKCNVPGICLLGVNIHDNSRT